LCKNDTGNSYITSSPSVCLSVRLSAHITPKPYERTSPIFVHVSYAGRTDLLQRLRYVTGFINDITNSYHDGADGPESSTTLCLQVLKVAVAFSAVHQNAPPMGKFASATFIIVGKWILSTTWLKLMQSGCRSYEHGS